MSHEAGDTVVLTGANAGIGYGMLTALVDDGYRVAGLDIEGNRVRALATEHPDSVRFVECDVTRDDDVEAAVDAVLEEWGRVDVLINNAAILGFGFFDEQTTADTERVLDVNYLGYVRLLRAVLPGMRERGSGHVYNVSSGVALVGNPGLTNYAASKGAIEALTRSLRHELRHEPVSCSLLQPRLADTEGAKALGYPESQLQDPGVVGRKLASTVGSTDEVLYADWVTRIGLWAAQRVPGLVERGTERFLSERA